MQTNNGNTLLGISDYGAGNNSSMKVNHNDTNPSRGQTPRSQPNFTKLNRYRSSTTYGRDGQDLTQPHSSLDDSRPKRAKTFVRREEYRSHHSHKIIGRAGVDIRTSNERFRKDNNMNI